MELVEDFYYRGNSPTTALDDMWRAGVLAVDMETVSLNDYTAIGIGVYWSDTEGAYFPVFPETSEHLPLVLGKVANTESTKIFHNGLGFDLEVLEQLAQEEGFDPPDDRNIEDSSIMAQVSGLPAGLQRLGEEYLGDGSLFGIQDLFVAYKCRDMLGVPTERVAEKCLNDCRTTWRLYHGLTRRAGQTDIRNSGSINKLSAAQGECYETDRRLIHILRAVSRRGLALRQGVLAEYEQTLSRECLRIERECDGLGFNPGSPQQVGYVLAARGNILPFTDRTQKRLSTATEVLEDCEDELAQTILSYRHSAKLLSSYVRPWRGMDRAYTHFRLNLATGRLASGRLNAWDGVNRNLQNVPPGLREIFRPDSGVWTWADYSQIELRVLAWVTQDQAMMAEYAKEKPDLHEATRQAALGYGVRGFTRDNGKTFNFARIFGAGDRKLSRSTGVPMGRVPMVRAAMASVFPESEEWIRYTLKNHGPSVDTAFGRSCRLPEMQDGYEYNPRAFQAHVDKCAVNYIIQGTAADLVKRAMVWMWEHEDVDLRLQVHDEFLIDGDWLGVGTYSEHPMANIHPELVTPFEVKKGLVWS